MEPPNLSSPSSSQQAAVTQSDPVPEGLYESLKQEKAKFTAFMESNSRALDGSLHSLYGRLEYVYQKRDELIRNPTEFEKFKNDDFFECSDRKPNEGNLIQQLLFYFDDAKTKKKRDRWSKATAVLEHFRGLGIGHGDVARLMKERNGFVKIYNSLPSAKPVDDGIQADHDLFTTAIAEPSSETVGSINSGGSDLGDEAARSDAPEGAVAVERVDANPEPQGQESPEPSVGLAATADRVDDLGDREGGGEHARRPTSMSDAVKDYVLFRTSPLDMQIALNPGRMVVFAEVTEYGKWCDVETTRVFHLGDARKPWPELDFSRRRSESSEPDTLPAAVDMGAHALERSIPHMPHAALKAPLKQPPAPSAPTAAKQATASPSPPKAISIADRSHTTKAKDVLGRSGMRSPDGETRKSKVVPIGQSAPGRSVTLAAKPSAKGWQVAWSSTANLPKLRKTPAK